MEKKLKLNQADDLKAPSLFEIKDDINKLYDNIDSFFGNVDISNLNSTLAGMLEQAGQGEDRAREASNSNAYSIYNEEIEKIRGYPHSWHTQSNRWSGKYYEAAIGTYRMLVGYLRAEPETPLNDNDENSPNYWESISYPHAFDFSPFVYAVNILPPLPNCIEELSEITHFRYPSHFYTNLGSLRTYKSGFKFREESADGAVAPKIAREILLLAIGRGDFDVGPTEYVRPDFNRG